MPYTAREALTVAMYNAGIEPLQEAFDKADSVIDGLAQMGWVLYDEWENANFKDPLTVGAFLTKTALRAVPDL